MLNVRKSWQMLLDHLVPSRTICGAVVEGRGSYWSPHTTTQSFWPSVDKRLLDFFLLEPLNNRFGDVITHGAGEREGTTGAVIACSQRNNENIKYLLQFVKKWFSVAKNEVLICPTVGLKYSYISIQKLNIPKETLWR